MNVVWWIINIYCGSPIFTINCWYLHCELSIFSVNYPYSLWIVDIYCGSLIFNVDEWYSHCGSQIFSVHCKYSLWDSNPTKMVVTPSLNVRFTWFYTCWKDNLMKFLITLESFHLNIIFFLPKSGPKVHNLLYITNIHCGPLLGNQMLFKYDDFKFILRFIKLSF